MLVRLRHLPAHEALGLRLGGATAAGRLALALGFVALWLLARRYAGIAHDATVYVAQGLRQLDPAAFAADLFFAGGAQDAYTLFPRLYAPLIEALGIAGAAAAVTIAGQLAFVVAAVALVSRLLERPLRWWALALLAVSSGYYGGVGVFRIAEPFATARTLAEPLVVAALAFTLARRPGAALLSLVAAASLHPIVAAAGIAVVLPVVLLLWRAPLSRRALLACGGVALLIPSGLLIAPLISSPSMPFLPVALDARFDPAWRAAVVERSPHVFLSQWHAADWSRLAWGAVIVIAAARFLDVPAKRLSYSALAVTIAALAVTWIGVDVLELALVAAIQPWRVHWLLHLLAILLVPVAVAGAWRLGPAGRAGAACIAASACFGRAELAAGAALAVLGLFFSASALRAPDWLGERASRFVIVAALAAAAVGLLFEIQSRVPPQYVAYTLPPLERLLQTVGTVGALLPVAIAIWLLAHGPVPAASMALAAALLATAGWTWDARNQWQRFIEQEAPQANPFRLALSPGSQVFWRDPGTPAWLVLRTASWVSPNQGAGVVFDRGTALAYAERIEASEALIAELADCAMASPGPCAIEPALARQLCARSDAPDALIVNAPIHGAAGGLEWRLPGALQAGPPSRWLYRCTEIERPA